MNSLYTRCAAALLCATTLAACGGDEGSIPLGGNIYGLNRAGLVLTNKGQDLEVTYTSGVSAFAFKELVANDAQFEILVKNSPPGQVCTASNNVGRANYASYQQTIISCTTVNYALSGTVSGLTGAGLVLANGSTTVAIAAGATKFTFGKTVPNGLSYGVTVLSQPAGQTCTLQNAVGTMTVPKNDTDDVSIKNVVVTCN